MSTPSTASRRAAALPPQQRREAIIDAVRPLLLEQGEGVTIRQIAAAAGVAEGTIFGVFADKDELLGATLEAALDIEPFERAMAAIDQSMPFEQRLISAATLIQARVVDVWQLLSSVGPRQRERLSRPMIESAALVELLSVEPHRFRVDASTAARTLRALSLSLTHPMLTTEPASPTDIVDLFLRGVGAPS